MSMTAAFITRQSAFLMTDSMIYEPGGAKPRPGGKLFALPAMQAAFSLRGAVQYSFVLMSAVLARGCQDYDELMADAGDTFAQVRDAVGADVGDGFDGYMVGYSRLERRPAGVYFRCADDTDMAPQVIDLPVGQYSYVPGLVPGYEPDWKLMKRNDPAIMFTNIATVAQRMAAAHYPDAPVGGKIIMAEVGNNIIRQRVIANLAVRTACDIGEAA